MTRIAVGGFLHETNTFAPTKATYDEFIHGGGWPPMREGAKLLEKLRNINVGIAGFIPAAEAMSWELVPTIWCAASPSAHVTKDAYERVAKAIVDGVKAAGAIDAVYLDLHGAMVAEHLEDGEGEIFARVRDLVGTDCRSWSASISMPMSRRKWWNTRRAERLSDLPPYRPRGHRRGRRTHLALMRPRASF